MRADDRLHRLNEALAGRYTIDREIGRGGMATVYLARDLRHDRLVAVKVLAAELGAALGPERFLSEIHVTAALQHPNLLPLFDSGGEEDLLWYVMPYVEGESLRARLDRERELPIDRATHIAASVAAALDYAHRHGVIHRDLKPENILLHDGEPLVADFGIALAISHVSGTRVTQTGFSLGTPSYMSPEQAAGERNIDGRSDVYALGCVLYEMLTGEPPYGRTNPQAVLARIMTEPVPSVRARRPSVPAPVEAAVARALAKIPADRFETARDFGDALTSRSARTMAIDAPTDASIAIRTRNDAVRSRYRDPLVLGLAVVAVSSLLAVAWLALPHGEQRTPLPVRFVASEPGEIIRAVAISPDARSVAYVAGPPMTTHLVMRPLGELRSQVLDGSDQAVNPFFSPDGRSLGFFTTDDRLEKVSADGGDPQLIAPAWRFSNGCWAPDGHIVFTGAGQVLSTVPASGGTPHPLTPLDNAAGEVAATFPIVLADGTTIVYAVRRESQSGARFTELAVTSLSHSGALASHTRLGVRGAQPLGVVDGWLVYVGTGDAEIMAVRFDASRATVDGDPITVLRAATGTLGSVALAGGTLVYAPVTNASGAPMPLSVDVHGVASPLGHGGAPPPRLRGIMYPRVSPDGRRVAFMAPAPDVPWAVWTDDIVSGVVSRVTGRAASVDPEWTPDGRQLVFAAYHGDSAYTLESQPADGSAPAVTLASLPRGNQYQQTISADARTVIVQVADVDGRSRLWSIQLAGDHTPRMLSSGVGNESMPRLSPDSRWLAYVSDQTGSKEVYVRPFPGPGAQVQISNAGGVEPMWSTDGTHLFYRRGSEMWEASVTKAPGLAVTSRSMLFQGTFAGNMPHADYAVMPDGGHFVMQPSRNESASAIVVVDWVTELRARLAAARR